MRKAIWWIAAVFGLVAGALLAFVVFHEWLEFSERNATKTGVALGLLGASGAYELAKRLLPAKV